MPNLAYDLHIHSCLSPCGDDDMLPSNIVGMAAIKGLEVIAVTDHNSCKNCPAVMKKAAEFGIIAIPGMEVTTAEEVHVICLFSTLQWAMKFDEYIHSKLPKIPNDTNIFGKQQIVDENDIIIGEESLLLISAVSISFDQIFKITRQYNGIMLPAHIDKSSNSLLANLGFIPPDSQFSCAEVKHTGFINELIKKNPYLEHCRIISNSDAHYLENINEPTEFIEVKSKSIQDILYALTH